MEDDILDNSASVVMPQEGNAYVSVAIGLGNAQTKAGSSNLNGTYGADRIDNCALFLLDENEQVVGFHTEEFAIDEDNENPSKVTVRFLTKYKVATKAVAVVDYNPNNSENLLDCSNLTDLKAYKEHDANYRIKFGVGDIDWSGVSGSSSTNISPEAKPATVSIEVANHTAIVELVQFSVRYDEKSNNHPKVELTEVSVSHLKENGGWFEDIKGIANKTFSFDSRYGLPLEPGSYNDNDEIYPLRVNVYPNTDGGEDGESFVTLHIKFSIQDVKGEPRKEERKYIINRPTGDDFTNNSGEGHTYVKAGYWYQLKATVNVHSDYVDCDVVCYTRDWIKNSINGDLN